MTELSKLLRAPTAQELRAAIAYEQSRPFGNPYRVAELKARLEATLINPPNPEKEQ